MMENNTPPSGDALPHWISALRPAAKVGAAIGALLITVLAFVYTYELFSENFGLSVIVSLLEAFASVGLFVIATALVLSHENNAVRGVSALAALMFGIVTTALVGVRSFLINQQTGVDGFAVPDQLLGMGRVIGAILPAAAAIAIACIWAVHRSPPSRFASVGGAVGHYLTIVGKVVVIFASMGFGFYFGVNHGVNPFIAILACGVLELLFVASYNNVGHAHESGDAFDMVMWGLCAILVGGFIAVMSIESISTLSGLDVMPEWLRNAGAVIFVSSVGISLIAYIITGILTKLIDIPMAARRANVPASSIIVRKPDPRFDQLAQSAARSAPQLPPGEPQSIFAKNGLREPVKGVDYDLTGEIVMPTDNSKEITKPLGKVAEQARQEVSEEGPTQGEIDLIKQGKSYRGLPDEEAERVARLEWEFDHTPMPPLSPEEQAALASLMKRMRGDSDPK